jgi:site-specific recombinase
MQFKLFPKNKTKSIDQLFSNFEKENEENAIDFLIELVENLRPSKIELSASYSIRDFIDYLNTHPEECHQFKVYIKTLFNNRRFTFILSDTGIIKDSHFFREIKERIIAKFLPVQPDQDSLQFILNQVLYKQNDYQWIERIPVEELFELASIIELNSIYRSIEENSPITEILNAMSLIIQRISGRMLELDVLQMIPEYENIESPFEAFEKQLDIVDSALRKSDNYYLHNSDERIQQLNLVYASCQEVINQAFRNSSEFGISLKVNQSLLRIQQQLNRLGVMIPFLTVESSQDKAQNSIHLGRTLIRYNCKKNNIRKLIGESTQSIAFEITQHTAKTGEHYITQSKKEYFHMLLTAMGGGLIVGFLCVFKLLLSGAHVSDFGHAVLYSLNYSFGFILIYLMGFTLATKQPAMTAATIVQSIQEGMLSSANKNDRHLSFAKLFAQLFRSQFIAFVGNVIIAFPIALSVVWLSDWLIDYNFAEKKADKLLSDLSPWHSPALFHAAIAGVFLFLSGVISGSISNRNKHKKVYYRISEHPVLKLSFGREKTKQLADWFEEKWPGVASNFWFGVFMGSTAIIGAFLGLNLDIRHITFASGNLALGLFGVGFEISPSLLFWGIFGIAAIGFVNFIVSFLLSLGLAFRSRNIPVSEVKYLFKSVWKHFKKRPLSFFIPIK